MKNINLKLAVLGVFSLVSAQAISALVTVPTTGFATSAYTPCMANHTLTVPACGGVGSGTSTVGNFGSGSTGNCNPVLQPAAGVRDTCAIAPAPASDVTSPVAGFTIVTSAARTITVNNVYTGGTNKNVGTVNEYVWRNAANTECIYGAKVTLTNTDYNTVEAGSQRFEVNDLARGGFDGLTVDAGYATIAATASPVYRIGRSYNSVQHRGVARTTNNYGDSGDAFVGTGYLDIPSLGTTAVSINGVNRYTGTAANTLPLANPIAAEQNAQVRDSWVDFTFDGNAVDDDGSTNPLSAMTYVKAACTSAAPVTRTDAIRLRQTAQEKAPFISVSVTGFVPPTAPATLAPAATVPF